MTSTISVEPLRTRWVPERGFLGVSALLFATSAAATVAWCASMSGMGAVPMPGGWTLSTMWMPMCGQTWPGVAASFLGMWTVMMVAMMLPSLVPMLRGYREAVDGASGARLDCLTALAGTGYFLVWVALGGVVFALGAALVTLEMQWPMLARAVPVAVGLAVVVAGVFQCSRWKARHLVCCRAAQVRDRTLSANADTAWRHGLRLGLHCSCSCAGLTVILLVIGIMDLRAMAAAMAAITLERLAPAGERIAHAIGTVAAGTGLLLIVRAVVLG